MPVRNVSVAAHSSAGKTTLTEALLHVSGAVSRPGSVDDGTSVSDHTEAERARGFSIQSSVVQLRLGETVVNLLDTPGYADFVREIRGAIRAADSVLVLVSAVSGVEVGTERVWATADRFNMPRIVLMSKMDRERADFYAVLSDIRASLKGPCVAASLPIGQEAQFEGVVDLLTRRAIRDGQPDGPVPDDLTGLVETYRTQLIEAIVETDDALVERYLEGETLDDQELRAAYLRAVHAGLLYPVLPVSAVRQIGLAPLTTLMVDGLRSPEERGPLTGQDGQKREPTPDAPFSARVWRTSVDPYLGRVAYLRVWSGRLHAGDTLLNSTIRLEVRPAHLYTVNGKDLTEVSELSAGMLGAITRVEAHTGDTLCDPAAPIQYDPLILPDPVHTVALHPRTRQDEDRLSAAMQRLLEEDPTLRYDHDPDTGELTLSGMGDLHLDIAVQKLAALGVALDTSTPKIAYRETLRGTAQAQGKHKKQSGGHGQYGDCTVRLEPSAAYTFGSEVVGGAIPGKYLPAIEKGVQEAMRRGVLAGYPVQGVRVAVLTGSYHEVDSSEQAFRMAGALAFRAAAQQARPVLQEPVMTLRVRVPAQYTGDIISDLQTRRARVQGMEPEGTVIVISAAVPQAEVQAYSAALRSMTGDRGAYSLKFSGYQDVPQALAERIIAERQRELAQG
ncbi:elongation factor G [Deinococcus sonorensis]|uniref:Elongation factor G n=2 Tax=Deinococcus sonorensis TaxID=309891 RepID=A0AAU7UEZ6_9DEIO